MAEYRARRERKISQKLRMQNGIKLLQKAKLTVEEKQINKENKVGNSDYKEMRG